MLEGCKITSACLDPWTAVGAEYNELSSSQSHSAVASVHLNLQQHIQAAQNLSLRPNRRERVGGYTLYRGSKPPVLAMGDFRVFGFRDPETLIFSLRPNR